MFIDQVKLFVKAGDGGNGMANFRREKYVPRGGPAGGDGGRGGDVIFEVSPHVNTLLELRYQRHHRAEAGSGGGTNNKTGRDGQQLIVPVPPGTIVYDDDTNMPLADLTELGQRAVIAKGGRGGRGNARFATATEQAPTFAEKGEPGEERYLRLELKLLADVGLVGFPNAGKSTLLAAVSAARPKVADYPFTTLSPILGVVGVDESSFVMADIPGLIEGAHQGAGLGLEFLRHIERTRVLLHIVDASPFSGREPLLGFHSINHELLQYAPELAERPQIIVLSKADIPEVMAVAPELTAAFQALGHEVFLVSAATGSGLEPLLRRLAALVRELPAPPALVIPEAPEEAQQGFWVIKEGDTFFVKGRYIERRVAMTNLDNEEAFLRLQHLLRLMGVFRALEEAGVQSGDTVRIHNFEFDYLPDPWQEKE